VLANAPFYSTLNPSPVGHIRGLRVCFRTLEAISFFRPARILIPFALRILVPSLTDSFFISGGGLSLEGVGTL